MDMDGAHPGTLQAAKSTYTGHVHKYCHIFSLQYYCLLRQSSNILSAWYWLLLSFRLNNHTPRNKTSMCIYHTFLAAVANSNIVFTHECWGVFGIKGGIKGSEGWCGGRPPEKWVVDFQHGTGVEVEGFLMIWWHTFCSCIYCIIMY